MKSEEMRMRLSVPQDDDNNYDIEAYDTLKDLRT